MHASSAVFLRPGLHLWRFTFDALRHGSRLAALVIPDLLAPWRDPPSAEQLIDEAQRRSGLSDFGETPFMRPMHEGGACREEAELSPVRRCRNPLGHCEISDEFAPFA